MTNRETTAALRIERHRRSNTPIVFEFVDLAGDPYPVTGDFALLFDKIELPGVVAGNTLTFELSAAQKATHPQGIYPYKARRTESGRESFPFVGNLALENQTGSVASFERPVQQITEDNSGGIVGGLTVIAGPQGMSRQYTPTQGSDATMQVSETCYDDDYLYIKTGFSVIKKVPLIPL